MTLNTSTAPIRPRFGQQVRIVDRADTRRYLLRFVGIVGTLRAVTLWSNGQDSYQVEFPYGHDYQARTTVRLQHDEFEQVAD